MRPRARAYVCVCVCLAHYVLEGVSFYTASLRSKFIALSAERSADQTSSRAPQDNQSKCVQNSKKEMLCERLPIMQ